MPNDKKKLFAASAAYILGLKPAVKLKGSSGKAIAYREVLEASRNLYEALEKEEGFDRVDRLLEDKKYKAAKFAKLKKKRQLIILVMYLVLE